jgi:hypothetical protein
MIRENLEPEDENEGTDIEEKEGTPDEPEPVEEEMPESELAKVDIISGENKLTVSTPVKEFEEFKNSFKNMMTAFSSFIEATGLEIGKDETNVKINTLLLQFEQLKEEMRSEAAEMREQLVPRSDFDEYKASAEYKEAKAAEAAEDYVKRSEFEKFRQTVRDAI